MLLWFFLSIKSLLWLLSICFIFIFKDIFSVAIVCFVFYLHVLICYYLLFSLFLWFSWLLLFSISISWSFFFSRKTLKVSKILFVCLFVCYLLCFLSWNHIVKIHYRIVFLHFAKCLQFYSLLLQFWCSFTFYFEFDYFYCHAFYYQFSLTDFMTVNSEQNVVNSYQFLIVDYSREKLRLVCSIEFWMLLWRISKLFSNF